MATAEGRFTDGGRPRPPPRPLPLPRPRPLPLPRPPTAGTGGGGSFGDGMNDLFSEIKYYSMH